MTDRIVVYREILHCEEGVSAVRDYVAEHLSETPQGLGIVAPLPVDDLSSVGRLVANWRINGQWYATKVVWDIQDTTITQEMLAQALVEEIEKGGHKLIKGRTLWIGTSRKVEGSK